MATYLKDILGGILLLVEFNTYIIATARLSGFSMDLRKIKKENLT